MPLKPGLHLINLQSGLVGAMCILLQLPRVSKVVGPKRKKLAEAESQLEVANRQLKEKQDALAAVVLRVNSLKHQLADAESEQRQLNAQVRSACHMAEKGPRQSIVMIMPVLAPHQSMLGGNERRGMGFLCKAGRS